MQDYVEKGLYGRDSVEKILLTKHKTTLPLANYLKTGLKKARDTTFQGRVFLEGDFVTNQPSVMWACLPDLQRLSIGCGTELKC